MTPTHYDDLLLSIARTTADYRAGEIDPITPEHVHRWVCQFDQADRLVILNEMDRILQRFYLSEEQLRQGLRELLATKEIFGDDPRAVLREAQFLNIQQGGQSQSNMLQMLDQIVQEEWQTSIFQPPQQLECYFYIDDVLFSGNRAVHDIENWLPSAQRNKELILYFHTVHEHGSEYLEHKLQYLTKERSIQHLLYHKREIKNLSRSPGHYECFWPPEDKDEQVQAYVQQVQQQADSRGWPVRLFRRPGSLFAREEIFSSPQARAVVERAFLRKGAYIVSLAQMPREHIRPMGYEYLASLGFGAMVITYRNIANNCPLALWWGNPVAPEWHPFSKWYPLFLRRSYEDANF